MGGRGAAARCPPLIAQAALASAAVAAAMRKSPLPFHPERKKSAGKDQEAGRPRYPAHSWNSIIQLLIPASSQARGRQPGPRWPPGGGGGGGGGGVGGGGVHASQWPSLLPGPPPSSLHPPPSFLSVLSVILVVQLTHTHTHTRALILVLLRRHTIPKNPNVARN